MSVDIKQLTVDTPYPVGQVHFYLSHINGEDILFDTGPYTPENILFFKKHINISNIKHVFITHCHADHYGMAKYISEHSDTTIYIPEKDAFLKENFDNRMGKLNILLNNIGFKNDIIEDITKAIVMLKKSTPALEHYNILDASNIYKIYKKFDIRSIYCPYHTQSDIAYKIGDHLITGDILLRGIFQTPLMDVNYSNFDERFNSYKAYCKTIRMLIKYKDCIILPGHRRYVENIEMAVLFYVNKMFDRIKKIYKYLKTLTIPEVTDKVLGTGNVSGFLVYIKISEIMFFKDFLDAPEILKSSLERVGIFQELEKKYNYFL